MAFIIAKNTLHCIQGIASKLQKNGRDVYEAYQMIDDVRKTLKEIRSNIDSHLDDWFEQAKIISERIGIHVQMPHTASCTSHRANTQADTTSSYYKRNLVYLCWITLYKKWTLYFVKIISLGGKCIGVMHQVLTQNHILVEMWQFLS
jgi:hypothetical protein